MKGLPPIAKRNTRNTAGRSKQERGALEKQRGIGKYIVNNEQLIARDQEAYERG
jgi:hypothetical protein